MSYRINTGDIFEVQLTDKKVYFQFIYKDNEYMAGHLIRSFAYTISINEKPELKSIIQSNTIFYAYTRVIEGLKEGFWKKIGNIPIEDDFTPPIFRQTNDVYSITPKSNNWFIWQKEFSNKHFVGELNDEYKKLPVSAIYPPRAIVRWLETGDNGFKIPN